MKAHNQKKWNKLVAICKAVESKTNELHINNLYEAELKVGQAQELRKAMYSVRS